MMIVNLKCQKTSRSGVPRERSPARTHARRRGFRQLLLELREAAEIALDRGSELTCGLTATTRLHVLPEDAVEHVTGEIECQSLLDGRDGGEVAFAARLFQLLQGLIGSIDVGLVMLVVMQLHDARRDLRLQRTVVIRKIGKHIFRHLEDSCSTSVDTSDIHRHRGNIGGPQ